MSIVQSWYRRCQANAKTLYWLRLRKGEEGARETVRLMHSGLQGYHYLMGNLYSHLVPRVLY